MKKIAIDERGAQKIRKYLTGGAAGGASIGLGIALMNYLKDLYREAGDKTNLDDDTLYLDLPENPQVAGAPGTKVATVSGGLAITGGLLTALGSAALVRKLVQEMKKKELQEQLDKAQGAYQTTVMDEADSLAKGAADAGVPLHKGDWATSLPLSLLLLTTLASGALTYKGLNKYFPAPKKPQSLEPKRVVIRRKKSQPSFYEEEGNDEEMENADFDKVASYEEIMSPQDIQDDALELVIKIAMHNPAGHSDLRDLVYAVAHGRSKEASEAAQGLGMEHALDLVKNASQKEASEEEISLAVCYLTKSSYLRPTAELLAFAEFNDMAPSFVKLASQLTDEAAEYMIKIAGVLGAGFRNNLWNRKFDEVFEVKDTKEASMLPAAVLEHLLQGGLEGERAPGDEEGLAPSSDDAGAEETPLTTDTESEVSESQNPNDAYSEDLHNKVKVREQAVDSEDEIDALLSNMAKGAGHASEVETLSKS